MKRSIYLLLATLFLLSACSSDSPITDLGVDNDVKKYDVVFNIENFQQETSVLKNTTGKYVAYWVYDYKFENIIQQKEINPAEFNGNISLYLAKGDYKIVAFAADEPIGPSRTYYGKFQGPDYSYINSCINYNSVTNEIFKADINFTVGDSNEEKSLTLVRPISRIKIAISDLNNLPSSVNTIVPIIYGRVIDESPFDAGKLKTINPHAILFRDATIFSWAEGWSPLVDSTNLTMPTLANLAINKGDISKYNESNPISFYFPNNQNHFYSYEESPCTFELYLIGTTETTLTGRSLLPGNENIVFSKLLKRNLQLFPNQSITVSGALFDEETPEGFSVTLNADWGETQEIEF